MHTILQDPEGKLNPGDYASFIDYLEMEEPENPEVIAFRAKQRQGRELRQEMQVEMQVEMQDELAQQDQDDDAWCQDMLARAEEDDPESEPEYSSNSEIERAFADGKI